MASKNVLYTSVKNPLLLKAERPLPRQVAVIGAGTIGPDIGYYLKSALPDMRLFLVDVVEEPLKKAEKRLHGYTEKSVERGKMKDGAGRKGPRKYYLYHRLRGDRGLRPGDRGCHREHPPEAEDIRPDRKPGRPRYHHHFQHQLHPGRPHLLKLEEARAGHRDPFLCPRVAQPGC